jgi:hypothetical protein
LTLCRQAVRYLNNDNDRFSVLNLESSSPHLDKTGNVYHFRTWHRRPPIHLCLTSTDVTSTSISIIFLTLLHTSFYVFRVFILLTYILHIIALDQFPLHKIGITFRLIPWVIMFGFLSRNSTNSMLTFLMVNYQKVFPGFSR